MSAEHIKQSAVLRFAAQGFDATTLAEIATDAGIKTPSIYAHFASKQALFWKLLEIAVKSELNILEQSLSDRPVVAAMHAYLQQTVARFAFDPYLRFWLRSIYLPPVQLMNDISTYDKNFAAALENIISKALKQPEFGLKNPALPNSTLTLGFTGLLRSVHAQLLYCGNSDSEQLLDALWDIFKLGLQET